jgi:hypothetical protein
VTAGGDQVVENKIGFSLSYPACLIFAAAVLKIENRISCLGSVVVGWKIYKSAPPRSCHAGVVPGLAYLSVGNVLRQVIIRASFGHLHSARPFAAAEICRAARIAYLRAIHDDGVVVKPGSHCRCRKRPEPVGLLLHVSFWATPEVDSHFRSIGRLETDLHPRVAVDLGILRIQNIRGGGLEVARILSKTHTCCEQDNYSSQSHCISSVENHAQGRPHLKPNRPAVLRHGNGKRWRHVNKAIYTYLRAPASARYSRGFGTAAPESRSISRRVFGRMKGERSDDLLNHARDPNCATF